jgi:hypothetical protein
MPLVPGGRRSGISCSPLNSDAIGAWWEEKRDFMQPSEFILNQEGRVIHSTYSSSPVGRTDPAETLVLLNFLESRRRNG